MGWHWDGEAWYWDYADGEGPPPWEVTPSEVALIFARAGQTETDAVLRACRAVGAVGYVARDGGARVGVPMDEAVALLGALGEDHAPARIMVTAGPTFLPSDAERIRAAAGSRTVVEVADWNPPASSRGTSDKRPPTR